ncbi:MAG: hypothetical protein K9N47_21045 [Prosthecobacter sp.]|uniref:hypothetical protein n=1 Tax=Prosthecobacter sp. TaxID=1965333 RepID=UPI00260CAB79|nr:hypothetical protein [Prosthecobacter sp.]MCF7788623.1 hypothetical protein [Prosthecobacter sp.]
MTTQTDTHPGGPRKINAGADLTGLEGRLVKIADGGSIPEVVVPAAVTDICPFILVREAVEDSNCDVLAIAGEKEVRIRANGTGSAGNALVLCDPAASSGVNAGKVEALGTTEGAYYSPGVALEDFVDEQLVRIRPHPRMINVGSTFSAATPAATAATNSTPYGFSQAQADAILANVRDMRAFMVAQGWKATA